MQSQSALPCLDWREVFHSAPCRILLLASDAPRFTILGGTDEYFRTAGVSREDAVGMALHERFPDNPSNDSRCGFNNLQQSLARVIETRKIDVMAVQRYDIPRSVELGGGWEQRYWSPVNKPILDQHGLALLILHRVEDVTSFVNNSQAEPHEDASVISEMRYEILNRSQELARANEQLRSANQHLERALVSAEEGRRTKESFLANISHEIRTPLNAVIGFAQLLERDCTVSSGTREHVELIHTAGEHLLGLLNDILDLAKMEADGMTLQRRPMDPRELLQEMCLMMSPRCLEKGLELHLKLSPQLPAAVLADPLRLRQMVLNLLSNAIKFTQRGSICLEAYSEPIPTSSDVHSSEQQLHRDLSDMSPSIRSASIEMAQFVVTISDTGPGINEEDLQKLFNRFEQGKTCRIGASGGTGLGLAISQQLAHLMRGGIEVTSKVGHGSRFRLRIQLPILDARALEHSSACLKERAVPLECVLLQEANQPILIVDDSALNRRLLLGMLRMLGFSNVLQASNGVEAVELTQSQRPRVVLMDLLMPVMDGFAATRRLREILQKGHELVVVAVSASIFDRDSVHHELSLFQAFLPKPIRMEALQRVLAVFGGFRFRKTSAAVAAAGIAADVSLPIKLRVLVADSNVLNGRLMVGILSRAGHTVDVCASTMEAVLQVRRQSYDVIILDHRLYSNDDSELSRTFLASVGTSRLICMLSDVPDETALDCYLSAGFSAVLPKPFHTDELLALVQGRLCSYA
jgi:signal transduction histidine kinase/DNA-binding response OmpR family regulator